MKVMVWTTSCEWCIQISFVDYRTKNLLNPSVVIAGIIKVPPSDQLLYNKDQQIMEDDKTISDYGYTAAVSRAQTPGLIGLSLR